MTYGEIEFLDEPDPPADGDAATNPADPSRWLMPASVVGWLAAAVLAVLAPFRAVYSYPLGQTAADYLGGSGGVDGWGRSLLAGASSGGVRFGIALVVCGALFVAMAVLATLAAERDRHGRTVPAGLRRAAAAGAIAAPCLLLGVLAALALYVQSVTKPASGFTGFPPLDVAHAGAAPGSYVPLNGGSGYSSALFVSSDHAYRIGGCLWLALTAAGCAVVAALVGLRRGRGAAVSVPEGPSGRL